MIEAIMFWNEPNNLSHWDFELDPEWKCYASMVRTRGSTQRAPRPHARLGRHFPHRPWLHPQHGRSGRARRRRRGGSAWLSAGLEPLADPRVGGEAHRDS